MIQIYAVNLESASDRKMNINLYAKTVGISINFVNAIVGKDLSDNYIGSLQNNSIAKINRPLSSGEVGCYLSHIEAIKQFLSTDNEIALIIEDDIKFDHRLKLLLEQIDGNRADFDILLIGYRNGYLSLWGKKDFCNYKIGRFTDCGYGAHAYLITRKAAKKIISDACTPVWPFDYVTGGKALKGIKTYGLLSPIIELDESTTFNSSLEFERNKLGVVSDVYLKRDAFFSKIRKGIKMIKPIRKY